MVKERIILGIDPGSVIMGYGILRVLDNKPHLETMGVIQLGKYEDYYLRLKKIFERVLGLIDQYLPDELAIEAPFYGKNVQKSNIINQHIQDKNVDYRKRQCVERAGSRNVATPFPYSAGGDAAATGCDRRVGCGGLSFLSDQSSDSRKEIYRLERLCNQESGQNKEMKYPQKEYSPTLRVFSLSGSVLYGTLCFR